MTEKIIQWGKLTPEERNKLIAEKVMGWEPTSCHYVADDIMEIYRPEAKYAHDGSWMCGECGYVSGPSATYEHVKQEELPGYTQSMDAAWELIRKMAQLSDDIFGEWWKKYEMLSNLGGTQFFEAEKDEMCVTLTLLASWTPERLCLAALRAVGYRMEEE